jgi:type I restriction enzyme, S subunit
MMTDVHEVPIGAVTTWLSGGTPSRLRKDFWEGDIPWISAFTLQHSEVSDSDQHITEEAAAVASKMAPLNSTLLLVRGSALHKEVRASLVTGKVCFNQDVKCLIPYEILHPKFLTYSILGREKDILKLVSSAGNTAGVLDTKLVQNFKIYLPELNEQRAIAEALSDVDGLIAALEKLIAKKRAIKQAAMQQLLTGKTRLPGSTGEWHELRLGDIAHIKTGSRNNQDKVEDGQYPFFVRSETVERINTFSYDCEAIVVPGEGGIGSIFHYINGKFELHQRVYKISDFSDSVCGKFIYYMMVQWFGDHAMRNTVKATVDSLRLPTFQNFAFSAPLDEEEQAAIANVLSDMDTEIASLQHRRDKTQQIKQGMMQQLLTGRVRLVEPGEAAS